MLRASAIVEKAGIPTTSLVCDGFHGQARAVSGGFGVLGMPVARIVGHVDSQSDEELRRNVIDVTVGDVISHLTETPLGADGQQDTLDQADAEAASFDELQQAFITRGWSDGLPVIPPTEARVAAFLMEATDDPNREIGVMLPSGRMLTPRNVAANGVMAGCRPAYMPVLVAVAEVMADPAYGVQHSGDTTGGEALAILSGPVVEKLGFNSGGAALRDGYQANTSVGRFIRLLLRNVAGSRPDGADKSTFGNTWRVVLAEDTAAVTEIGWPGLGEDQGHDGSASLVTMARYTGGGVVGSIYGRTAAEIVPYLADGLVRQIGWELAFTVGFAPGTYRPLLVLSPLVAKTLSKDGIGKARLQHLLFEQARMPASKVERYLGPWANLVPGRRSLADLVKHGLAAPAYAESEDPDRLVPIASDPAHFMIVVSGDPMRSNAYAFGHNGMHGFPTSRVIRLPE